MIEINKNTCAELVQNLETPISVVPLIDGLGSLWLLNEEEAGVVRRSIQYPIEDTEWFAEFQEYLLSLYSFAQTATWSNKYDIDSAILYFLMFHKKKGTVL